jgi:putative transposase
LSPTVEQQQYFVRASGVARFAYNWALAEWERQKACGKSPSECDLRRQLNAIKRERFPWMLRVTKNAPQQAIKNLGDAFSKYYAGRTRHPKFKKKGRDDRFRADPGPERARPDAVLIRGKQVKLPIVGWVRMREELRFAGRILSVIVSRRADGWYASFMVEQP